MTANMTSVLPVIVENLTSNYTEHSDTKDNRYLLRFLPQFIYSLIILISIPGIIGNGIVIRVLGFQIKRNSFTVYILNLAVADGGTLLFLFLHAVLCLTNGDSFIEIIEFLICTYYTGQHLLTIISIDRCLALFFPIWHRCHQPPYLSTILCAIPWIVSILFNTIHYILISVKVVRKFHLFYFFFIYISASVPLMVVSSLALLIKGYFKSQMQRRGRLLKVILLALFFFLIFSFPIIIIHLMNIISNLAYIHLFTIGYLCACLNSSVNPLIYFLLGRKKEVHSRYNLKIILQRVFKEEEENKEQPKVQADIQL